MVDRRIARRRQQVREQRRRRRLRRTVGIVILLGIAVALLIVERSPLVAITQVRVTGTHALDPEDVRDAAGIAPGTSLLRLPLTAATQRVEELPRVRRAEVVRVDPLTVEIRVDERIPTMVAVAGESSVLVDDDGMVIDRGDGAGLVPIRVESGDLPAPGESVLNTPVLANAVTVATRLPDAVATLVTGYRGVEPDRVILILESGTEVEFGRAEDIDAKARALSAVLEDLGDRAVATIDVRAPSAPVVTP